MIRLEDNYFSINKILLLVIGLWPYKQTKLVRLRFILFSNILIGTIIFQLTVFLTFKCTPDLIAKVLSTVLFFSIFVIKYISFGTEFKTIKEILKQLQYIHDELKDANEIAIMRKYSHNAKRFTIFLISLAACGIFTLVIIQLWSDIFDIILPINRSEPHHFLIMMEYFIDQEKYYYLIMLHINITICLSTASVIAIGTILISFCHHICGMFRIARYRIEHSMKFNMLQNNDMNKEILISEKIIYAVDIHRQAIKLSLFLVSKYEIMLSFLIIFGVVSLSLNLFRIFQVMMSEDDTTEIIPPFLYIFLMLFYMFIANYLGQNLTDHSKNVFSAAYKIQWYTASLHIQKLILFLLQKGYRDFNVNIGGLFVPSIEGFAMLVKTSVSYFTVIYSTR
ncbi:hypothetical protein HN011_008528 [Eciton burchellii]|nr:hypothetical protein HN011_008528 [Eciton burchellii]